MNRYSRKIVAIKLLRLARLYVPAFLLYYFFVQQGNGPVSQDIPFRFFIVFIAVQISLILGQWISVKYQLTPASMLKSQGALFRDTQSVAWSDVVSFQVTQPALLKLFGCYELSLGTGARNNATIMLEAVNEDVVTQARALFDASRSAHPGGAEREVSPSGGPGRSLDTYQGELESEQALFAARPFDYFLISLTYGQFLLFVPAAIGAYSTLTGGSGLSALNLAFSAAQLAQPLTLGIATVAAVCVALLYGVLRSYLTYKSFRVIKSEHGLEMTGGLSVSEQRTLTTGEHVGVRLRVNLLMRPFSAGKLSVISQERGHKYGSNVVLPVAQLPLVATVLRDYFPLGDGLLRLMPSKREHRAMGVVGALLLAALAIAWAVDPGVSSLLPFVIVGVLLLGLALDQMYGTFAVQTGGEAILVRRGLLSLTLLGVPLSEIQSTSLLQVPIAGHQLRAGAVTFFDGRRRRVFLLGLSARQCVVLEELMQTLPSARAHASEVQPALL